MITSKPIPEDLISREKFYAQVRRGGGGCIVWPRLNQQGYGRVRTARHGTFQAHRVALALDGIEMPPGTVVDHTCRNRACVNVAHLEVVEPRVNTARGMSPVAASVAARDEGVCINGHEISEVGLHRTPRGWTCAQCGRDRVRRHRERGAA